MSVAPLLHSCNISKMFTGFLRITDYINLISLTIIVHLDETQELRELKANNWLVHPYSKMGGEKGFLHKYEI